MKISNKILVVTALTVFTALSLVGCKDNPYPNGQYTENRPARQVVEKAYVIDAPKTVDFSEGVEGSFTIRGLVPPPGQPVITLEGMPAGSTYSAKDNLFTWKPSYTAADDPAHPNDNVRNYVMTATVHSTADNKGTTQEVIKIAVHDSPRSYKLLNFIDRATMYEGVPYTTTLSIEDLDYPKGPFLVTGASLPDGVAFVVDPMDPAAYSISYTPDYDVVDSNSYGYKSINWSVSVVDPRGRTLTIPVVWSIYDSRLDPTYVGPTNLSTKAGNEVDFVFIAQDPNLEIEPTVTPASVAAGSLEVTRLNGGGPNKAKHGVVPFQTVQVRWSNIPASEAGKTETLNFDICVYDRYHRMTQCLAQKVKVDFAMVVTPAPIPSPSPTLLDSVSEVKSSRSRALTIYGGSL